MIKKMAMVKVMINGIQKGFEVCWGAEVVEEGAKEVEEDGEADDVDGAKVGEKSGRLGGVTSLSLPIIFQVQRQVLPHGTTRPRRISFRQSPYENDQRRFQWCHEKRSQRKRKTNEYLAKFGTWFHSFPTRIQFWLGQYTGVQDHWFRVGILARLVQESISDANIVQVKEYNPWNIHDACSSLFQDAKFVVKWFDGIFQLCWKNCKIPEISFTNFFLEQAWTNIMDFRGFYSILYYVGISFTLNQWSWMLEAYGINGNMQGIHLFKEKHFQ